MDRWHHILTVMLEHDETGLQWRGTIRGPIITAELCQRIETHTGSHGSMVATLKTLQRRGLVVQVDPSECWFQFSQGKGTWAIPWRLTEKGRDQSNWPTAPQLHARPSRRTFPTSWELHKAAVARTALIRKMQLMPFGPERDLAFDLILKMERDTKMIELTKRAKLARTQASANKAKTLMEQFQQECSRVDKELDELRRTNAENHDELVRLGQEKPRKILSIN